MNNPFPEHLTEYSESTKKQIAEESDFALQLSEALESQARVQRNPPVDKKPHDSLNGH